MDLKQLDYFVHVAETGSFTRAAALLSIAQPALSRQVRQLEVELRQTLLVRNGRGVTVTEPGRRLLEHARGILHQVERARQDLEEIKGAPVGRVAIAMPPSVGRTIAAPVVAEFTARFPRATVGIVEGLTTHILEWLATGRVDIGLVYNPPPSPVLDTEPLLAEQLYLIGPASARRRASGKSLPLAEVPRHRLIIPSRPHAMRMFIETQMANAGLRMNVAWEVDSVPAILDLVQRGHGFAVLPLNAIRGDQRPFVARPIVRPKLASLLAVATAAQRPSTPLARQAIALIREVALAHLKG